MERAPGLQFPVRPGPKHEASLPAPVAHLPLYRSPVRPTRPSQTSFRRWVGRHGRELLEEDTLDGREVVSGYVFQAPWTRELWPRMVVREEPQAVEYPDKSKGYPRLRWGGPGAARARSTRTWCFRKRASRPSRLGPSTSSTATKSARAPQHAGAVRPGGALAGFTLLRAVDRQDLPERNRAAPRLPGHLSLISPPRARGEAPGTRALPSGLGPLPGSAPPSSSGCARNHHWWARCASSTERSCTTRRKGWRARWPSSSRRPSSGCRSGSGPPCSTRPCARHWSAWSARAVRSSPFGRPSRPSVGPSAPRCHTRPCCALSRRPGRSSMRRARRR